MDKKILISYAKDGREAYTKALVRNIKYARKHWDGDMLYLGEGSKTIAILGTTIEDRLPDDCKPHSKVPYQFKPFLFTDAINRGYTQVLWLDSTICVMNDLTPIFDKMRRDGVVAFHNEGFPLKDWISDEAVQTTGIDLSENPYEIMACVMGFDLEHPKGREIFNKWLELSQDGKSFEDNGSTRQGFRAHRHDQAVLSALLWKEKIKLLPYGNLVYEAHKDGVDGKKIYFMNKGL